MKIAVVSPVLPPFWSGQAILIYRLLKDRSPNEYCLLSQEEHKAERESAAAAPKLAGRYCRLSRLCRIPRGHRLAAVKRINIYLLGRQIAAVARRQQCSAIVAFSGNMTNLPASLLASRILNIPCYAYFCDYYSYQQVGERGFAEQMEAQVLRGAAGVVVPNEFLHDELKLRYGVDSTIIYNPCDLEGYEAAPAFREHDGEQRIVYTGAVYEANYDAFRNLIGAIELLGRSDIRLHLFTAQSPGRLREAGIRGPVVFHNHANIAEIPAIQKQADLLFLPLAFDSPYPEIIRTSAPFKMGEYLAAQRPVLVHAPADSFISWYFREHECGFVVDENDPAKLADGIKRLLCDTGFGQKLCSRASERARAEFSGEISQARFAELLKLAKGGV
jgi:glycosyltransferase involved in cell wall biosynthesis